MRSKKVHRLSLFSKFIDDKRISNNAYEVAVVYSDDTYCKSENNDDSIHKNEYEDTDSDDSNNDDYILIKSLLIDVDNPKP